MRSVPRSAFDVVEILAIQAPPLRIRSRFAEDFASGNVEIAAFFLLYRGDSHLERRIGERTLATGRWLISAVVTARPLVLRATPDTLRSTLQSVAPFRPLLHTPCSRSCALLAPHGLLRAVVHSARAAKS